MRFGVEHEIFVFREVDARVPSRNDVKNLFNAIASLNENGNSSRLNVSVAICNHTILIECDAFTHIVEIVLPPISDIDLLGEILDRVFWLLDAALEICGLTRLTMGSLAEAPQSQFYPSRTDPKNSRIELLRSLPDSGRKFFHVDTMPSAASTQVSFHTDAILADLTSLYAVDLLVPLYFSNSSSMLGLNGHSLRPLFLWDYFDQPGVLSGIPIAHFELFLPTAERSRGTDYSFIANRSARLEFRSACSQPNTKRVCDQVQFRIELLNIAAKSPPEWSRDYDFICGEYRKICLTGRAGHDITSYASNNLKAEPSDEASSW